MKIGCAQPPALVSFLRPLERVIYRLCGIRADEEMDWREYARAVLGFRLLCFLGAYALQRFPGQKDRRRGTIGFRDDPIRFGMNWEN